MSSINQTISNSQFDEHQWVIQIRRLLSEELEEDENSEVHACIYSVPKALMVIYPDSYVPQQIAIGPYHYRRPEIHEMERYKLGAAKWMRKEVENRRFEDVVDRFKRCEVQIRACYLKYLTLDCETLAWMMAVDACFLLEFLEVYAIKQCTTTLPRMSSRMSHLVNKAMRKTHLITSILRDIVMLENQIPLFVLTKMLEFQYSCKEIAHEKLYSMLLGLYKEIFPFKMNEKMLPQCEIIESAHLLDFLYILVVPKISRPRPSEIVTETLDEGEGIGEEARALQSSSQMKKHMDEVWKILSKLKFLKKIFGTKFVLFLMKLPWKIISKFPGAKLLQGPIGFLCDSQEKEEKKEKDDSDSTNKPPLIEEIVIPSVTELSKAGVCFIPTNEGIMSIAFDENSSKFYLPTISLDSNTEVVLRNLVAYEAYIAWGPLIFTRYTELMNGIIDNVDDARILREKGVVLNHLKSDEEVVKLWNGMSRSVRLTKAPVLDKLIEDVNKFYGRIWNVEIRKTMKAYVYGSWQFLAILACTLLLLLTILQAFCSVYSCKRLFNLEDADSD